VQDIKKLATCHSQPSDEEPSGLRSAESAPSVKAARGTDRGTVDKMRALVHAAQSAPEYRKAGLRSVYVEPATARPIDPAKRCDQTAINKMRALVHAAQSAPQYRKAGRFHAARSGPYLDPVNRSDQAVVYKMRALVQAAQRAPQ